MSAGRVAVGHPVDVGSGAVFTAAKDFVVGGGVNLVWRRYYSSGSTADSWLGPGWFVPFFMTLRQTDAGYLLTDEQGDRLLFPSPRGPLPIGESVLLLGANMELRRERDHIGILHWHHGRRAIERFVFPAVEPREGVSIPLGWIENLAGHRLSVEHDSHGRPVSLVQELEGRRFILSYGRDDLLSEVQFMPADGSRRWMARFVYGPDRRLVAATDAAGNATSYRYDASGRMVEETNPLGSTFRFEYDRQGRCVRASGDGGYMERQLSYSSSPARTRVIDSRGQEITYYLNPAGQVVQEMDAAGAATTTRYDEYGRPTTIIHPDGGTEQYGYDAAGNRNSVTDPCGGAVVACFNHLHLPTEVIDANGSAWGFEYDVRGNLTATANPLGHRWTYAHDARGLVTEFRTPGGRAIRLSYGPGLRWREAADQLGFLNRIVFDEWGDPIEFHDAEGLIQRMRFDELHRLTEVRAADGTTASFQWTPLGKLARRIGPEGEDSRWEYDRFGQLIGHTTSAGILRIEYDREGEVTAVVNRAGERHEFTRGFHGRVVSERFFDGRSQAYEYDHSGRQVAIRLNDGRRIEQAFDKCSRLIARKSVDGFSEAFAYNLMGAMSTAAGKDATVTFERDPLDRVIAEEQNGLRLEYEYDPENRRVGRRIPGIPDAEVRLAFDLRGQLISISDANGLCQTWEYDRLSRPVKRVFPGSGVEYRSYDQLGRLVEQRIEAGRGRTQRIVRYDRRANVAGIEERGETTQFGYDDVNRLVAVRRGGAIAESYRYDANGTILSTDRGDRQVAPGGRTLGDGERTFEYDPNGCVSAISRTDARWVLEYDVRGRMTAVHRPGLPSIQYIYDPLGRRLRKQVGGEMTRFLWEGGELAAELPDGGPAELHYFSGKTPLAHWRGRERLTPIVDHLGTARELLNDRGEIEWSAVMRAFGGEPREPTSTGYPVRFRGQFHDPETGFHYNFHRYYDPDLGDYLTPDPIGLQGGANFYAYPRNPLRRDDPLGLTCTRHKGQVGEQAMDDHYMGTLGYDKISTEVQVNGIDAVYMHPDPNHDPRIIIAEAKYGTAGLSPGPPQQMSNQWIDSSVRGTGFDRLTVAVGPEHVDTIRDMARDNPGSVQRDVFTYTPPAGSPMSSVGGTNQVDNLGAYNPTRP